LELVSLKVLRHVGRVKQNLLRSVPRMHESAIGPELKDDSGSGRTLPRHTATHDIMTSVKLWQNPCWFTYRLNYLALRYNGPLYAWVEESYGLSRPEFVVIFSLGLVDDAYARDIGASSGFPQNTLSRAIHKLTDMKLLSRTPDELDGRRFVLALTFEGRALFDSALPRFVSFEKMMLDSLTATEQQTLSALMAKMVLASPEWPDSVDEQQQDEKEAADARR